MLAFISSIFYLWILHLYFRTSFSKRDLQLVAKITVWIGFYFMHSFILANIQPFLLTFILGCCLLIILCESICIASHQRIIFTCLIIYIFGMLAEICVSVFLQLIGFSGEGIASLGSVISKLILLAAVHAITIFRQQQSQNEPSFFYWILLVVITLSSILAIYTVFLFLQSANSSIDRLLSTLAILALLLINVAVYIIYDKLSAATDLHIQILMMRQQIARYHETLANKKANDFFFATERHNLKNQLIGIRAYALKNQTTEIVDFINTLLHENEFGLTPSSFTDNILVDSLLCSKKNLASQGNIRYSVNTSIAACLPFPDADLCTLIGNALDNAFEACLTHKNAAGFVNVTIQYKTNCLYCHFENSYYGTISFSQSHFFHSTKPDRLKHGYGLRSIKYIASKYDGTLSISTENNTFSLKVLLYAPQ